MFEKVKTVKTVTTKFRTLGGYTRIFQLLVMILVIKII